MAGKKERQRKLARERYARQQARRAERTHRWRVVSIIAGACCAVVLLGGAAYLTLGNGGGNPSSAATANPTATPTALPTPTPTPTPSLAAEPATHCTYTTSGVAPAAKKVSVPPTAPNYKAAYTAAINTNLGTIDINLLNSKATCTVNSFVHLASAGYFNASQCHRVTNTSGLYVLQCGDPYAKASTKLSCSQAANSPGTGGPGYEFASENLPTGASSAGTVTYKAGTVAMANSGTANSNGSQFFLVYKNSTLGPDYTPFGTITSGLDILQKVANAGTSCTYSGPGDGAPKEKVVINSVTIKQT